MITMGSLFSGFGGFEIAAKRYGIKILWQSEIEPWAVKLLERRFPKVKQLGDINNVRGTDIEPVDIITFGSPCQDMSVAGGRKGMKFICPECGEEFEIFNKIQNCPICGIEIKKTRSGLFTEAIRVIREMRKATNGKYPKFAVWENVPGAFTSNNGNDFRTVLEEITESKIPMPKSGRWANAGMVRGRNTDISWRVLDAQYWGVPQRRKRIYLVADYRGRRSAEILFKSEGLSGHTAQSEKPQKDIAVGAGTSIKTTGRAYRISSYYSNCMQSDNPETGFKETSKSCTLDTNCANPARNQGGMVICEPIYIMQGNMIGRSDKNGPQGKGITKDICYTLTAADVHALGIPIALESHPQDCRIKIDDSGHIQTLTQKMGTGGGNVPLIMLPIYAIDRAAYNQGQNAQFNIGISDSGITQTVVAKGPNAVGLPIVAFQGQASESAELSISDKVSPTIQVAKQADCCVFVGVDYIVRRLTPRECAKLQGFPANWHENVINEKGKPLPDSAAYKGYGNAVATVCAEYVLRGIAEEIANEKR